MDKVTREYICSVIDCLQDITQVSLHEYMDSLYSAVRLIEANTDAEFPVKSAGIWDYFPAGFRALDIYADMCASAAGQELGL